MFLTPHDSKSTQVLLKTLVFLLNLNLEFAKIEKWKQTEKKVFHFTRKLECVSSRVYIKWKSVWKLVFVILISDGKNCITSHIFYVVDVFPLIYVQLIRALNLNWILKLWWKLSLQVVYIIMCSGEIALRRRKIFFLLFFDGIVKLKIDLNRFVPKKTVWKSRHHWVAIGKNAEITWK